MDPAFLLNPKSERRRGNNPSSFSLFKPFRSKSRSSNSIPTTSPFFAMEGPRDPPSPAPAHSDSQYSASSFSQEFQTSEAESSTYLQQLQDAAMALDHDELTVEGQAAVNDPSVQPAYDPRVLLNPKATSKRPASSDADSERGREDIAADGQISLVERLHNVQQRTSSPAKRPKTDDERKRPPTSNIASGSTLAMNPHTPVSPPALSKDQSACVDLTMSK